MALGEVAIYRVVVERRERQRGGRARTVVAALATTLVVLAVAAVVGRVRGRAELLGAGRLDSSYESTVFPAYHDSRLAPASVLQSLGSHDTFASAVFPKYAAFVNGGDESGLGRSVLRKAQSDANRWMRLDQRDWQGRGAEYLDSLVAEGHAGGEQLAATGQLHATGGGGRLGASSLLRAEAAAAALTRTSSAAAEAARAYSPPRAALAARAPHQKLYIPAIYNDKIDPAQEMQDMMDEFSAIIKQITELQAQMECAARCSNSTVNSTTLNLDGNTLDVTFDDSHKNVTGGVLTPAQDDAAAMACLKDCGIDEEILNATYTAEDSTRNKLSAILRAVAAEKSKMAAALQSAHAARAAKQTPALHAAPAPAPAPPAAASVSVNAKLSPKEKTAELGKWANSFFGHTAAHAKQLQADEAAAKGHFAGGKWVDDGHVHAVQLRDRAAAGAKGASSAAQVLRHTFEYQLAKSESDAAARAWKPPPKPDKAPGAQRGAGASASSTGPHEAAAVGAGGQGRAVAKGLGKVEMAATTAARQQLLQVGTHMVQSSRKAGAVRVQRWLSGHTAGGKATLVDWSLDLPGLDKVGVGAGSANIAAHLIPPRDTIRHTAGECWRVCAMWAGVDGEGVDGEG
jgi:hypothetical protein